MVLYRHWEATHPVQSRITKHKMIKNLKYLYYRRTFLYIYILPVKYPGSTWTKASIMIWQHRYRSLKQNDSNDRTHFVIKITFQFVSFIAIKAFSIFKICTQRKIPSPNWHKTMYVKFTPWKYSFGYCLLWAYKVIYGS